VGSSSRANAGIDHIESRQFRLAQMGCRNGRYGRGVGRSSLPGRMSDTRCWCRILRVGGRLCGVREIAVFGADRERFRAISMLDRGEWEPLRNSVGGERAWPTARGPRLCVLRARLPLRGEMRPGAVARHESRQALGMGLLRDIARRHDGTCSVRPAATISGVASDVPLGADSSCIPRHLWTGAGNIFACLELGVSVFEQRGEGSRRMPIRVGRTGNVTRKTALQLMEWASRQASVSPTWRKRGGQSHH